MEIGIATRSKDNSPFCGDQCAFWHEDDLWTLCVVDGLGHGQHTELAAKSAIRYTGDHLHDSLCDIFSGCNTALRDTRGVAMCLARVQKESSTFEFSGINNTRATVFGTKTVQLDSDPGIVGGGTVG